MSKNIRHIISEHMDRLAIKKTGIAEKSLNEPHKIGKFINGTSGIFGNQLVRLLLALGYKIVAPNGEVILGKDPEKEIRENFEDK